MAGGRDRERSAGETRSLLLVPVWTGLLLGTWWAPDRLLARARWCGRSEVQLNRFDLR